MSRYLNENAIPGNGSYVGLALPGEVGSWQRECKVILSFSFHSTWKLHIIMCTLETTYLVFCWKCAKVYLYLEKFLKSLKIWEKKWSFKKL